MALSSSPRTVLFGSYCMEDSGDIACMVNIAGGIAGTADSSHADTASMGIVLRMLFSSDTMTLR